MKKLSKSQFGAILGSMILVLLTLSGCGNEESKQNTHELNYGSTKDIQDLNPHLYNGEMAAQNMVFEGLTKNEDGKVKPELATSWKISSDGKVYTFKLRHNVTFSNGEKFDATVVKKNFDAVMANKERHEWMGLVEEIKDTKVVSPDTFQLTLKQAYYPTLIELGLTRPFTMLAPSSFKDGQTKDGIKEAIGTGPYVLKKHEKNKVAVFTANEKYWGDKPKLTTINWKVIPDVQSLFMAFKKGDVNLIYGSDGDQVNMDTLKEIEKDDQYKVYLSEPNASRSILLNTNRGALKNIKVRQAVSAAINKKEIVDHVLDGMETPATTLLPKTAPYCDLPLKTQSYDVTQAKQLLDEAGWKVGKDKIRYQNGQPLELTFSYNSQNAQEGTIAEAVQANLADVGIKVNILAEDKQAYLNRQKDGDFDMQYSLSWGAPYDPQTYLSSWRIPAHGDYQAQLGLKKKKWLDAEIGKVLVSTNTKTRAQEYKEILTYINNEYVYVPLSYSRTKAVADKKLQGVKFEDSQYEIPFASMSWKDE